jgi:hypothetical protein
MHEIGMRSHVGFVLVVEEEPDAVLEEEKWLGKELRRWLSAGHPCTMAPPNPDDSDSLCSFPFTFLKVLYRNLSLWRSEQHRPTSRALFEDTGYAAAGGADSVQGTAV